MPIESLKAKSDQAKPISDSVCYFGQTNYRGQMRKFGIKLDDRRRHMYVIGKTGMGKTTMMENMVLHDIYSGHGVGVVDPHGDFAEKIIDYIPSSRINDVVYFNPSDLDHPIGFNILEVENEEQKHLVASGLMATFKKIWPDVWSSRMEYILNNTLLALLDYPGSTLLGINRLLADKAYRKKVISKLKDPVIKAFWQTEFASYNERYAQEAVAPIQNKIGQFLSASVIRNMVAQVKSTVNIRDLMDNKKILIMNLSKGRIGEDNSRLLGGMLITEIQLAAMARVDMPEEEREDFFLYVDEFQNFATPSFANILSEARKYRLSLIMAHQYVAQLDEIVADAVFGNVGTITTFRVGGADAEMLEKEFDPVFLMNDIVNLPKFQIFLKLMIDGVASHPFSAMTMSPIGKSTGSAERVIKVSRERYGKPRDIIEEKIIRWSGMGALEDDGEDEGAGVSIKIEKKDEKKSSKPSGEKKLDRDKTEIKDEPEEEVETISLKDLKPKESKGENRTTQNLTSEVVKKEESKISSQPKIEDKKIISTPTPTRFQLKEERPKEETKTISFKDLKPRESNDQNRKTQNLSRGIINNKEKESLSFSDDLAQNKKGEIRDYFEKNANYIIRHGEGDHKYAFLTENKPKDIVPDDKGRVKGSTYKKNDMDIYDVKVDMYEPVDGEDVFGKNRAPDVWVGTIDEILSQVQAIKSGKGGGSKFLGIEDKTDNKNILQEKIQGTGLEILTVVKKRKRKRKKKTKAQVNNDLEPQVNVDGKLLQNTKTDNIPLQKIKEDQVIKFDNGVVIGDDKSKKPAVKNDPWDDDYRKNV